MDINSFISVISNLNNGSVIFDIKDSDSEIILGEKSIKLYKNIEKYYFLAEYNDNYDEIEEIIKSNEMVRGISDLRPNNSYITLLYKVKNFSDDILKKIIRIEENEFFYKKYVFYYTESELESFNKWFKAIEHKSLSEIFANEDCSPESDELYVQFLLRLIIKLPFLKLIFKKMEFDDFDDLVENQLKGIRNNQEGIKKLYSRLCECLENSTSDAIAKMLFDEIIKEDKGENQIN